MLLQRWNSGVELGVGECVNHLDGQEELVSSMEHEQSVGEEDILEEDQRQLLFLPFTGNFR